MNRNVHLTAIVKGANESSHSGALAFLQVGQAAGWQQSVARSNTMPHLQSSCQSTNFPALPPKHFQQRSSLTQSEERNVHLHTPSTACSEGNRDTSEFIITGTSVWIIGD